MTRGRGCSGEWGGGPARPVPSKTLLSPVLGTPPRSPLARAWHSTRLAGPDRNKNNHQKLTQERRCPEILRTLAIVYNEVLTAQESGEWADSERADTAQWQQLRPGQASPRTLTSSLAASCSLQLTQCRHPQRNILSCSPAAPSCGKVSRLPGKGEFRRYSNQGTQFSSRDCQW